MHASGDRTFDSFDVEVSLEDLPPDLEELAAGVDDPEVGFFGPGTVTWRVNRENALLLSGMSALLLQIGHPMVAAGVADHSDFDADPIGRFQRTFEIVDNIVFGDLETALTASLIVRRLHSRVVGELQDDVGPFEAGDDYDANRPDLLLWVQATLLDQALVAYETYVEELTDAEREQYYREGKTFGRLMGIPESTFPETLEDFYDHYEETLASEIAVGSRGGEMQETLFSQYHVFGPLYGFLGASTMPEPAREAFDLPWGPRRRWLFDRFAGTVNRVLPYLPARLRYDDHYRENVRRLGLQPGAEEAAVARPTETP
jgi:uncharacterized protein (DUF2236 family)